MIIILYRDDNFCLSTSLCMGAFTVASGHWFPRLNKISNKKYEDVL